MCPGGIHVVACLGLRLEDTSHRLPIKSLKMILRVQGVSEVEIYPARNYLVENAYKSLISYM